MSKSLVAYFSASGVTKRLAERLASATGSDIYEIVPEDPYTDEDLNWKSKESRSSIEMKDRSFRPAVANSADDIDNYGRIYVGFPIWWYTAPTIINTFLEQQDLSGKELALFATSGSSDMGSSAEDLAASCKGAKIIGEKRFEASADKTELAQWADSL